MEKKQASGGIWDNRIMRLREKKVKESLERVEFELLMKTQEKMTRRQTNLRSKVKLLLYMLEWASYTQ